jgi:hypothetical protein
MPLIRCDFHVATDLVLPVKAPDVTLRGPNNLTCKLHNGAVDKDGHVSELIAVVVAEVTSMDRAENELRGLLASQLDLFAFVVQSRFQILSPIRAIEWEPRLKKRHGRIFHEQDPYYPPAPDLAPEFGTSINQLNDATLPDYVRAALKLFRYGLLGRYPEDQFMYFWLAVEILAENSKGAEAIAIPCGKCGRPLVCECGAQVVRKPMPKDAINQLISNIGWPPEFSKPLFDARNALMHGASVETVEKVTGESMAALMDTLGELCSRAIRALLPIPLDKTFHSMSREASFVAGRLLVAARFELEFDGNEDYPPESILAGAELSLITRFKPMPAS